MSPTPRSYSWGLLAALGAATGFALHCEAPLRHLEVASDTSCGACHLDDYQRAAQPLHVGVISLECESCHTNTTWKPARGSAHSWPLLGVHAATACNACHVGEPPLYEGTSSACIDCHRADRDSVTQPPHAELSEQCSDCHGSQAWRPAAFQHEWPLEGAHAAATCAGCHGDPPTYDGTPTACLACHEGDRALVTNPPHDDFGDACESCHSSVAFRPAAFPAHEWPLEGAHAASTCASCHGDPPTYDGTPTACLACHEGDRAAATSPPHEGFSTECQTCHGTASWGSADFEHTTFELTGAHATASCESCHTGSPALFAGTARECVGCHRQDYDGSTFPGHAQFSTACEGCHTTSAWVPASGGGHPQDRFSITGRHDYACNECHNAALGAVNGASNSDCVGCHDGEHTLARMDNEHDDVGNYPRGAGRSQNFCLQCHPGGNE